MAKYKKTQRVVESAKKEISDSKLAKYLIAIPVIALLIKFFIMANIPGGGWYGADGENYAGGIDALMSQGFFSEDSKLNYWPAGYPLMMWPLAIISISKFYYLLSFVQSIFFAFSTYFFTSRLSKTSLRHLAFWVSIFISFNPTLSLASLTTGYEAPIASSFMMVAGILLTQNKSEVQRKYWLSAIAVGCWLSLAAFLQPRYLLIGLAIIAIWAFTFVKKRIRLSILSIALIFMLVAPAVLVFRNSIAINQATISTNLGVTMRIGAGPDTSGGYQHTGPDVPCSSRTPGTAVTDNELVRCVISWYVSNPIDTVRLSINKAFFFWSPWSGPEVEGTMARNPWLKISPAHQIALGSEGGHSFVYGLFGKLISWGWIIGQILFLFIGYRSLRKLGDEGRFFANILVAPVLLSWLISIGTIGDHRFRIPTMSLSLVLQVAAFLAIRKKLNEKVG